MNPTAVAALVSFTAHRVFTGKRFLALGLLLMIPPCLAGALAMAARVVPGVPFFDGITFALSLYLVLILSAMIYGIGLTSSEIEDGTVGYVFLAACPRWLVALVHVVVTGALLTVLTTASIAATYGLSSISPAGLGEHGPSVIAADALIAWIGLTTYLAWFVLCGYAFKHNVAASIASVVVWEWIVPMIPNRLGAFTVIVNLRVIWLHLVQSGDPGRWFRAQVGYDLPTYGDASMFLSVALALFLALGMVAAMNRSIAGREAG